MPDAVPELELIVAAKRRHWKEKGGRFWARIAVPRELQPIIGKSELIIALGGDLRIADRHHAAAIAQMQDQIAQARQSLMRSLYRSTPDQLLRPMAADDHERAAWNHYQSTLKTDEEKRLGMPTQAAIETEHERAMRIVEAGGADPSIGPAVVINVFTDYTLAAGARHFYANNRTRRLAAIRTALASSDTRLVDDEIQRYVAEHRLSIEAGSSDWLNLGQALLRAEAEALDRTLGRDQGLFSGNPKDPIVKPPNKAAEILAAVPLRGLFQDYITSRQALGKHRDGAKQWENAVDHLIRFLLDSDARKVTKRNLLDWRDTLLKEAKSTKTISNVYLASIRAVLKWAYENDRLPTNEGETVRQAVAKKIINRERGYTKSEHLRVLNTSVCYQPSNSTNPANRESAHVTAAKRWIPVLCAFTGARVTEMAQLRKEDIRQEADEWVIRIAPEAGSVKTGAYRDVPLHRQVLSLGFIQFI